MSGVGARMFGDLTLFAGDCSVVDEEFLEDRHFDYRSVWRCCGAP